MGFDVLIINLYLMMLENQQWATWSTCAHNDTCTTQKKREPNREHWCGAGQIPSEG